ncbi:MAG TPA: fibrobacter succinogenes major paralogous domain-containing protein [Bacteroidales bacterium]|nr:fibrobacter succinogenes major paralogous domain-containing protein [Bacteroidales bacterium]
MKKRPLAVIHFIFVSVIVLIITNGCKKKEDPITVTDIDGNIYKTVTIGSQIWLKENLRTTKYSNGDPIPEITSGTEWISLTSGAYCNYDNDPSFADTYGLLYNWHTVKDPKNICPDGWHVPSDSEWTTLIDFLGGEDVAGGKLKEKGTAHWISPNTGATDSYSFTALPSGYRFGGIFNQPGYYAIWWTNTQKDLNDAWIITLINSKTQSYLENAYKTDGLSVRCLKD